MAPAAPADADPEALAAPTPPEDEDPPAEDKDPPPALETPPPPAPEEESPEVDLASPSMAEPVVKGSLFELVLNRDLLSAFPPEPAFGLPPLEWSKFLLRNAFE